MEIVSDQTTKTVAKFIKTLAPKCPVEITTVLTDNGNEFIDRFCANGGRKTTEKHVFDKMFGSFGVVHRLPPPYTRKRMGWLSVSIAESRRL